MPNAIKYNTSTDIFWTMNDELLNKYRYEMTNERNDGWWKKHYEELYKKRIEEIKKKEKEQKETNSND